MILLKAIANYHFAYLAKYANQEMFLWLNFNWHQKMNKTTDRFFYFNTVYYTLFCKKNIIHVFIFIVYGGEQRRHIKNRALALPSPVTNFVSKREIYLYYLY